MKIVFNIVFVVSLGLIGIACEDSELRPAVEKRLKSYQSTGNTHRLSATYLYNDNGDLTTLTWKRETPNITEGTDQYVYDETDKVVRLIRSISGLKDEEVVYTYENNKIIRSEHFTTGIRFAYVFYTYDDDGRLTRTEREDRVPSGVGYLRGEELELFYNEVGDLTEVKTYSFNESSATLLLQSIKSFSNFVDRPNPDPQIEILPNLRLQNRLPGTLSVTKGNDTVLTTFDYTFDADGYPSSCLTTSNNLSIRTEYQYE